MPELPQQQKQLLGKKNHPTHCPRQENDGSIKPGTAVRERWRFRHADLDTAPDKRDADSARQISHARGLSCPVLMCIRERSGDVRRIRDRVSLRSWHEKGELEAWSLALSFFFDGGGRIAPNAFGRASRSIDYGFRERRASRPSEQERCNKRRGRRKARTLLLKELFPHPNSTRHPNRKKLIYLTAPF